MATEAVATGASAWLSLLFSLIIALVFAYFGLYLFKILSKKIIDESNKLNGVEQKEGMLEISVNGKTEYVEMTIEGEPSTTNTKDENLEQPATSVIAEETQKLPISVIVMFSLAGIYLIFDWVSALIYGFLI